MRNYFCKVSYDDPKQTGFGSLVRCHKNVEIQIDLCRDMWETIQAAHDEAFGRHADQRSNFTIDFMISTRQEDDNT